MPAIRALAVVLTAWVLVLLAPPGPASAGGPTSALLSVPGEGRTASLYYTDDAYDELAEPASARNGTASGTVDESGQDPRERDRRDGDLADPRRDAVAGRPHLPRAADGGPWIATQVMDGEPGAIWDSPVRLAPADGRARSSPCCSTSSASRQAGPHGRRR